MLTLEDDLEDDLEHDGMDIDPETGIERDYEDDDDDEDLLDDGQP